MTEHRYRLPEDLGTLLRREIALKALARRKVQSKTLRDSGVIPDNEDMPAGHPMHFACHECGMPMFVDEEYTEHQRHCGECQFLIAQGWLDG